MQAIQPLLRLKPVDRVRRNHGLEHATIHVLSARKRQPLAGYSDTGGFWLIGSLETADVVAGVADALNRMRNGEPELAVHPGCGTNYVTSGALGALAALMAFAGARTFRQKLARLPTAIAFVTAALIVAQPLGMRLQAEITTDGRVRDLEVAAVRRVWTSLHRIDTRG
jgi:hypothetical protein